ncbi:hypothetical protein CCR75_003540 [Bremia lactucae]|uniref:RxLR effector protein n=1 Tax=Bremia lactucae TaxID=4779 RepID=A0A976IH75_BRELC|nr:hypothetical protein CCR75_003540 [Bremia lactucae]
MATRLLTLLPVAGVVAWSGNASLMRARHQSHGERNFQFITGTMNDIIMETLETGDLVFFQRKLTALQPLAALHTWIMRKHLRSRFDHCGWIYVDRLGRKYIVEETLNKVQCRPYSARILTSQATEISVLTLNVERSKKMQEAAKAFVVENVGRKSRTSLRQTMSAMLGSKYIMNPCFGVTPFFPCAALVAEAYDAMDLANKYDFTNTQPPLSADTVTPRELAENKIKLHETRHAAFDRLLPIKLE